jgi:hypothetical protein
MAEPELVTVKDVAAILVTAADTGMAGETASTTLMVSEFVITVALPIVITTSYVPLFIADRVGIT